MFPRKAAPSASGGNHKKVRTRPAAGYEQGPAEGEAERRRAAPVSARAADA